MSCDDVLVILRQKWAFHNVLPQPTFWSEENCKGRMWPEFTDNASNALLYTCNGGNLETPDANRFCNLYTSTNWPDASDFLIRSVYLPAGFAMTVSGSLYSGVLGACGTFESTCDYGTVYNTSEVNGVPSYAGQVWTSATESAQDVNVCPSIGSLANGGFPALAGSEYGTYDTCLSFGNPGPRGLAPTGLELEDRDWRGNFNLWRVAQCMGRVSNDPGLSLEWSPQTPTCDVFMRQICQTVNSELDEVCNCIREANKIQNRFQAQESTYSLAPNCFTGACNTDRAYIPADFLAVNCNSVVCSAVQNFQGNALVSELTQTIDCNRGAALAALTEVTDVVQTYDVQTGQSTTFYAIVIAVGILFGGLFFYWLYEYLRQKYARG